jgi:hypothetical protein
MQVFGISQPALWLLTGVHCQQQSKQKKFFDKDQQLLLSSQTDRALSRIIPGD